ncbi:MAG: PPC domain-containing DNA-binding protein [Planctomycetota bacterium]|jgi:predicted DNA-binding protein with PD1-like motif
MKYWNEGNTFFLKLEKGDEVIESLVSFAAKEKIESATISGIGAIEQVTLGYFDVEAREYEQKDFPFSMELGALVGNITHLDGKPTVHAHATIGGPDLKAYTGHLFKGTVSVTGEILITKHPVKMERSFDEDIGLNLIDLK